jgi:hypothetical protein
MSGKKILQLKVKLVGSRPPIWRRILVPVDYSFFDLHVTIQDAVGWADSHLHQFFTASPYTRSAGYEHIAFPVPEMEAEMEIEYDERKEKLSRWFKKSKDTLWYEYDFGDSWMHEVRLEKVLPWESKTKYPALTAGKNACPFEDSGGLGGYYDKLASLKNPKDKEHQDVLDWLDWIGVENPSEFDPAIFNPEEVKFQNPKKRLKEYEKGFGL